MDKPAFENTYRLEPKEQDRFYPSVVKNVMEEIVLRNLKDKAYDHGSAKTLAEGIADQIKTAVRGLSIPNYKIVV